jgi:DNA-binding NtrC family response regulator
LLPREYLACWLEENRKSNGAPVFWTLFKLLLAIGSEFGITLGKTATWDLVRQLGFRQKVPRPKHAKGDNASRKTLDLLQPYSWPGNIRELQNVIERSIIVCDTENFSVDKNWLSRESCQVQPVGQPLSDILVSQTKEMIEAALAESGGRVSGPSGAAARLGMPASTLESQIKSLKINKYLFKKST